MYITEALSNPMVISDKLHNYVTESDKTCLIYMQILTTFSKFEV